MQSIIWVFGSTVILLLAISIVPLGFTFRGKLIIVFFSFLIALAGTAAAQSVSIWMTLVLLLILILLLSYLLDQRLGRVINKTDSLEESNEQDQPVNPISKTVNSKENKVESLTAFEDAFISNPEVTDDLLVSQNSPIKNAAVDRYNTVLKEEDLTYSLDKNEANKETEPDTAIDHEDGYLADIEHWIEVEAERSEETRAEDLMQELDEFPSIHFNKKSIEISSESDKNIIDDTLFEILLASEEAAVSNEDNFSKVDMKK